MRKCIIWGLARDPFTKHRQALPPLSPNTVETVARVLLVAPSDRRLYTDDDSCFIVQMILGNAEVTVDNLRIQG